MTNPDGKTCPILRQQLSEALREELRRQAASDGVTIFYEPRKLRVDPVTGKVAPTGEIISDEIEYEGSIYLDELADTIIRAIKARLIEIRL